MVGRTGAGTCDEILTTKLASPAISCLSRWLPYGAIVVPARQRRAAPTTRCGESVPGCDGALRPGLSFLGLGCLARRRRAGQVSSCAAVQTESDEREAKGSTNGNRDDPKRCAEPSPPQRARHSPFVPVAGGVHWMQMPPGTDWADQRATWPTRGWSLLGETSTQAEKF